LPNAECGKQLNTIADPRSTTEVKRVAVAAMAKSLLGSTQDPTPRASDTPTAQATQVTPLKFDFGEPESGKYYPAFISYKKTRVFQAVSAKKRFKMPISEALSHVKFRIGNKDSLFQLDVAVDTCAAMNLAYKGYHEKIAQQYPQLVAEYIDFRIEGYSTFDVGGIDDDEQGITVDAAITYLTPFFHNGEQVKLQFALSDSLTTNTILGFPSTMLHKGYVHSEVFNAQFPVAMRVPNRSSAPANVTQELAPTTLVSTANTHETTVRNWHDTGNH
jgi:hypothetical protein